MAATRTETPALAAAQRGEYTPIDRLEGTTVKPPPMLTGVRINLPNVRASNKPIGKAAPFRICSIVS